MQNQTTKINEAFKRLPSKTHQFDLLIFLIPKVKAFAKNKESDSNKLTLEHV